MDNYSELKIKCNQQTEHILQLQSNKNEAVKKK